MKTIKTIIASAILASSMSAAPAFASLVNTITYINNALVTEAVPARGQNAAIPLTKVSFTHNMATSGFDVHTMAFTSASLLIRLTDMTSTEAGRISIGNPELQFVPTGNIQNNTLNQAPGANDSYFSFALNSVALADLNDDGLLNVIISATSGDFFVASSVLTGELATKVPEPMSLSLFGAGLLGLAALRRRRAQP